MSEFALYALICLTILGWSGNYVAGKIALRELPPLLLSPLRVSLAGVLMVPFYWWERHRSPAFWTGKDAPRLLALGVVGAAVNQFFFVLGLSHTSVAHAVIFANMAPLLVLLLAAWRGLEKITVSKMAGLLLALAGVGMLRALEPRSHSSAGPHWSGDLLCLAGSVVFAWFTVFGKPVTSRYSAITVHTFAYVGGGVLMAPLTLWEARGFAFARVSPAAWTGVLYMALVSSVLCYLMYYHVLARMDASRLSAFCYLQPPLATLLGFLMLGERFSLSLALSAAVILAGLLLAERGL